jgi:flagellar biosynthesis protein FliR
MSRRDKFFLGISYFIRVSLIVAIFLAFYERQWINIFLSVLTLFLTFFPSIIKRNYKVTLPLEFEFLIIIFLYSSLFLGEVGGYYERFWYWDVLLHGLSSMILGTIGFLFVYLLNKDSSVKMDLGAVFVSIFSFSFALSIGALWEIFEFAMDSFFGFNMQKSGLVDTMWDLIIDALGALIISVFGYFYVKKVKTPLFYNFVEKFLSLNKK